MQVWKPHDERQDGWQWHRHTGVAPHPGRARVLPSSLLPRAPQAGGGGSCCWHLPTVSHIKIHPAVEPQHLLVLVSLGGPRKRITPGTMLGARTERTQDAKPANIYRPLPQLPAQAWGACPLHPLPQLALLGSTCPAPEGHLPQLLHTLPVPGLEALQAPALQEALLGRLLALLQDLLLVLQL